MHDELDLQIVHLLQINPRIPWSAAGRILGVSAPSLARRWARLTSDGLAWMSTYPSPFAGGITAFVDVRCEPGRAGEAASELCRHRTVLSLDECAGDRDLLLTVMVPTLAALTDFILDILPAVPGVAWSRCSLVTALHAEGSSWRVDALDPQQQAEAAAGDADRAERGVAPAPDEALLTALARDGRASVASLARELDRPTSTVHRQLMTLRQQHQVISRCDVAPELSGWQFEWSWFLNVPMADKAVLIETLQHRPELRMCMSVAGRANLVFSMRVRQLADFSRFEEMLAAACPRLAPVETMVHLRPRKRMGWLLTPEGRSTGTVIAADFAAVTDRETPGRAANPAHSRRSHTHPIRFNSPSGGRNLC